jgi:hypothetical protein
MTRTLTLLLLSLACLTTPAQAQGLPQPSGLYVLAREVRQNDVVFFEAVRLICQDAWLRFQADPPDDPVHRLAAQLHYEQMGRYIRQWQDDILRRRKLYSDRTLAQIRAGGWPSRCLPCQQYAGN